MQEQGGCRDGGCLLYVDDDDLVVNQVLDGSPQSEAVIRRVTLGGSLLLEWLLLLLLLLLLLPLPLRLWLLLLLPGAVSCLANAVSVGKRSLRSELSTRAPTRIKDAKVVMGWMLSRPPMVGCAPRMRISIDSSSEGLLRTCEAKARHRPTYSSNGSLGLCPVVTRSSLFGIRSRLKENYYRNA